MSGLEKEKILERIKSMSDEELLVVAQAIPTHILLDAVKQQDEIKTTMLQKIAGTLTMKE